MTPGIVLQLYNTPSTPSLGRYVTKELSRTKGLLDTLLNITRLNLT